MPVLSNIKHEKFAQAIVRGATLRAAATAAGLKFDPSNTNKLWKSTKVRTRINELMKPALRKTAARAEVGVDRLVEHLENVVEADITQVLEWGETIAIEGKRGDRLVYGVKVRSLDDIPPHVRSSIAEVRQTKDGIVIKLHDKLKAIDMLGRFRRMWADSKADEAAASLEALLERGYEMRRQGMSPPPRLIEGKVEP